MITPPKLARVAKRMLSFGPQPPTVGIKRWRDLLPLPTPSLSAEDVSEAKVTERSRSMRRCVRGWLWLMVLALNLIFSCGSVDKAVHPVSEPLSPAQAAAVERLELAAMLICDRNPGALRYISWDEEVKKKTVEHSTR